MENNQRLFWDPAGDLIYSNSFEVSCQSLKDKYLIYQKNPRLPLRNLLLCTLPVICSVFLIMLFPRFLEFILQIKNGVFLLVLPFLPAVIYFTKIKKMQRDLINYLIAQENQWIYSPEERSERWQILRSKFKNLFEKGDEDQNMQDEFWGKINGGNNFYMAIFEYTVVMRDSKGNRRRRKFSKSILALKLNKKLKKTFQLVPESFWHGIKHWFTKKEIETESNSFNRTFAFEYDGQKVENELEIVKLVSPAVQMKLIDLKDTVENFNLLFQEDTVLFVFEKLIFEKMQTNFFRKVEIDSRDTDFLKKRLYQLLEISGGIVPYLD